MATWLCPGCDLINSSSQSKCIACFQLNEDKLWECNKCGLINKNQNIKCCACFHIKSLSIKETYLIINKPAGCIGKMISWDNKLYSIVTAADNEGNIDISMLNHDQIEQEIPTFNYYDRFDRPDYHINHIAHSINKTSGELFIFCHISSFSDNKRSYIFLIIYDLNNKTKKETFTLKYDESIIDFNSIQKVYIVNYNNYQNKTSAPNDDIPFNIITFWITSNIIKIEQFIPIQIYELINKFYSFYSNDSLIHFIFASPLKVHHALIDITDNKPLKLEVLQTKSRFMTSRSILLWSCFGIVIKRDFYLISMQNVLRINLENTTTEINISINECHEFHYNEFDINNPDQRYIYLLFKNHSRCSQDQLDDIDLFCMDKLNMKVVLLKENIMGWHSGLADVPMDIVYHEGFLQIAGLWRTRTNSLFTIK